MSRSRPAFLAVLVPLVAAAWTAAAPARSVTPAVVKGQELALLNRSEKAYAKPARGSATLRLVQARRPLTGVRTVLPVIGHSTMQGVGWLHVRLPGRPNGHTGWIRKSATTALITSWHVIVRTSTRRVVVYRHGRRLRTFKAVVGKPSTPTPHGEYFVEEAIRLRAADVGAPFALALSARSNVLQEFDGGPGQIGLHGLANVGGVLGTAVSHGCVRLNADAMRWLVARIGPGVPVTIVS
ncbi:MAG: hypothetical protein QOJ29_1321 [Thermoleophilaceae bacterium]|nr:hypothetical protein [Thermoleophilaceae bacterium]